MNLIVLYMIHLISKKILTFLYEVFSSSGTIGKPLIIMVDLNSIFLRKKIDIIFIIFV